MTWFIFSILSITCLAFSEITQQYLLNLKDSFSPRTSSVLTFLIQSFVAIPFIFIFRVQNQIFFVFQDLNIFSRLLVASFFSSISMILYFKSFKVKSISLSLIFTSLSVVVSTILGIVFLSESVSLLKFLGIVLIILAIIFLNCEKLSLEKNNFYGLAAGLIFGFNYFLDKSIVLQIHPLIYIFWSFLMIALWGFIFDIKDFLTLVKFKSISDYKLVLYSGVGYFLFNLFTFTAYSYGGELGRVDAINNSQIFLVILFEFLILKQSEGIWRKLFLSIITFVGVLILGFAS